MADTTQTGLDPVTNLPIKNSEPKPIKLSLGFPDIPRSPVSTERPVESKYDVGTFPEQDLEEVRAERQGAGEELMFTAGRLLGATGTKILSGVSSIGEFIANTGRAFSQESLDPYFDTPVTDKVNKVEELLKENLPLYNEKGDVNKNFLQRAFTDKEFWMDDPE